MQQGSDNCSERSQLTCEQHLGLQGKQLESVDQRMTIPLPTMMGLIQTLQFKNQRGQIFKL